MEPLIQAFIERGAVLVVRYDKETHLYRLTLERGEQEPFRGVGKTFDLAVSDIAETLMWILDDVLTNRGTPNT